MKPHLLCAVPSCERTAMRERDGQRVCLFHPDSEPPTSAQLAAAQAKAYKTTPVKKAPPVLDLTAAPIPQPEVTRTTDQVDLERTLEAILWLRGLSDRPDQSRGIKVQADKAVRTLRVLKDALVLDADPATPKRTYSPEARARMVANGHRQAALMRERKTQQAQ